MKANGYYLQIVNSYLNKNDPLENSVYLSDDISLESIAKYICAMSNTAAIKKIPYIYAFWGINSTLKELTDTKFILPDNQELTKYLSNNIGFVFKEILIDEKRVVLLEVQAAFSNTIQFKGNEYILDDDKYKLIDECSNEMEELWRTVYSKKDTDFASDIALSNISASEINKFLDCEKLFEMLEKPFPSNALVMASVLSDLRFISEQNTGKYSITNLGALLLARKLSQFESVKYKAIRVLIYSGNNFTEPAHEQIGGKGYIVGFEGLIKYISDNLPVEEIIDGALRKTSQAFPILSIRELVANAIIHQDLNEKGSPIVSIFNDHIVISNPGIPIVGKNRFIDTPPYSRNESLAAAMHRVGICEERGSGYDKVITHIENNNLPAPEIIVNDKSTAIVLKAEKPFDSLSKEELVQICYSHTCINYVQGVPTNNTSLRLRLNIDEKDRYKVSRIFEATIEKGLVKKKDGTGPKNREYVPFWVE